MVRRAQRQEVVKRKQLTPEIVVSAAVELADEGGLSAVSMRGLASVLGVEAMSLYNHVRNKEQLFAAMAERVWGEVYVPTAGHWASELRLRYLSAHTVILAHPWVATLIESIRSGPVLSRSTNAVLGCLRSGGLPVHLAYRALLTLDSFLYGFCFQEVTWPHARSELPAVVSNMLPEVPSAEFPHLVEMMKYVMVATAGPKTARGPLDFRAEFEFGLDLQLQGLERALASVASTPVVGSSKAAKRRKSARGTRSS